MMDKDEFKTQAEGSQEITRPERPVQQAGAQMLRPTSAWQSLCVRTGGSIGRATFYRWLQSGKVYSIRLGQRIFIPQAALDELIKQCLSGERF
jgi:excisionase family DNA binding protein